MQLRRAASAATGNHQAGRSEVEGDQGDVFQILRIPGVARNFAVGRGPPDQKDILSTLLVGLTLAYYNNP
jgi:hypothetical protein